MSYKGRGWNAQELAEAGLKTEDGEPELEEWIGDDAFMDWRKQGDEINLKAKDHQWELGRWVVTGEDMKQIAGEVADQRFKHSVYAAAADITGYTINSIKSFATVVRNVPEEIKDDFPTLSFAHLKLVAKFDQEPNKQRDLLTEMLIGDLKVAQARERIRFLTDGPKAVKSKADRHTEEIIAHLNHVLARLENYDLEKARPKLQEAVLRKVEETRKALGRLTSQGEVAA
jgi:hypothetical protein